MLDLLETLLLPWGGTWVLVLVAAGWLAVQSAPKQLPVLVRLRTGLSQVWFLMIGASVALVSTVATYGLLWQGHRYAPQAGLRPWLPQWALALFIPLIGFAFLGGAKLSPKRRSLALLAVGFAIILSNAPLSRSPTVTLEQGDEGESVRYVQRRLARLGCFEAAKVAGVANGEFGVETFQAVVSFQQRNGLLVEPANVRYLGQVRNDPEFRLLTYPFPALGGPFSCQN